jgi:hypothetical protein
VKTRRARPAGNGNGLDTDLGADERSVAERIGLRVVVDNSADGRTRRWEGFRAAILACHCPSCSSPAGRACAMEYPIRVHPGLDRDFHLTRMDMALRNGIR